MRRLNHAFHGYVRYKQLVRMFRGNHAIVRMNYENTFCVSSLNIDGYKRVRSNRVATHFAKYDTEEQNGKLPTKNTW